MRPWRRIDLNGIIDLLYGLITPGISLPHRGDALLIVAATILSLGSTRLIAPALICDKPAEFRPSRGA